MSSVSIKETTLYRIGHKSWFHVTIDMKGGNICSLYISPPYKRNLTKLNIGIPSLICYEPKLKTAFSPLSKYSHSEQQTYEEQMYFQ